MIIDVVIPTIPGREASLSRCVDAYRLTTQHELQLTIVHDRPTVGIAWNDGVKLAAETWKTHDLLHLSADDLEPLPGWDEAALTALEAGHQPCPKLLKPDGSAWYYGLQQTEPVDGTPVEFSTIPFMNWDLWPDVGPSLECHYYTDNWLSFKAERIGYPSAYYSRYAFVHHHELPGRGAGMEENQRMIHDRAIYDAARRDFLSAAGEIF